MTFHAFHGCLEKERIEGNTFVVDFKAGYKLSRASQSDELEDAVDYGLIYDIVAREMKVPSKLLEHLARRTLAAIVSEFPDSFTEAELRVSKKNPPVNGMCEWSRISVYYREDKHEP